MWRYLQLLQISVESGSTPLLQCIAVNTRFLLNEFKTGAKKLFTRVTPNTIFVYVKFLVAKPKDLTSLNLRSDRSQWPKSLDYYFVIRNNLYVNNAFMLELMLPATIQIKRTGF
jgi:hypothetical protein